MNKFEALYIINKKAKKYGRLSRDKHRFRKKALYSLKHKLINEWWDEFETIEKHKINGELYYYVKKGTYKFHIPKEELIFEVDLDNVVSLDNFNPGHKCNSQFTEREALEYIYNRYNHNANEYFPENYKKCAEWGFLY